jgi:hypothetical protein
MFRDYLDEEYELRLPGGYPEGEPVFREREGFPGSMPKSGALSAGSAAPAYSQQLV